MENGERTEKGELCGFARRPLAVLSLMLTLTPGLHAQRPAAWHLVQETQFGGGSDPASELSDIRGVEVSKNGNVLVLDYKAQAIRVFAADGHYLKKLSRNGAGPGEFEEPNGFARSPDGNIWVNDPGNHRFTVLRDDGSYVKDVRSTLTSYGYIWQGYFDAAGRMVNPVYVPNARPSASQGIVDNSSHQVLERRAMISNRADTVPAVSCPQPGTMVQNWSGRSAHGGTVMGVPFAASESVVRSAHDVIWCASGAEYSITRLGLLRGDTLQTIHGRAAPLPVTAAERDSAVDSARALFTRHQLDPAVVRPGDIPRNKPVIMGLTLDDQNRLWVRLTPAVAGHTRYDIYDARGFQVGMIELAGLVREWPAPVFRGNKLYAVVRDPDDVPSVVRYRIE
jgi:hypothetical protein